MPDLTRHDYAEDWGKLPTRWTGTDADGIRYGWVEYDRPSSRILDLIGMVFLFGFGGLLGYALAMSIN